MCKNRWIILPLRGAWPNSSYLFRIRSCRLIPPWSRSHNILSVKRSVFYLLSILRVIGLSTEYVIHSTMTSFRLSLDTSNSRILGALLMNVHILHHIVDLLHIIWCFGHLGWDVLLIDVIYVHCVPNNFRMVICFRLSSCDVLKIIK